MATAALAFLGVWKKIIAPMLEIGIAVKESFPAWISIAEKFSDNHGGETISLELRALAANQELAAANQSTMLAKLEMVVDQSKDLKEKLGKVDTKLSETRHQMIGEVAAIRLVDAGAHTLVDALVHTSDELRNIREQLNLAPLPPRAPSSPPQRRATDKTPDQGAPE